jgi:hypothetical protein
LGGDSLLKYRYEGSLGCCLDTIFKDYEWKPWLFAGMVSSFWEKRENKLRYLEWLKEELAIKDHDDVIN